MEAERHSGMTTKLRILSLAEPGRPIRFMKVAESPIWSRMRTLQRKVVLGSHFQEDYTSRATISALSRETESLKFRTPMQVVSDAGGIIAFIDPDKRRGIATPWAGLNQMLEGRGFLPEQVIVVGARPSTGKTALACQIADFAASGRCERAFSVQNASGIPAHVSVC